MPIVSVNDFISKSFDYIIVGGGNAGLVVAVRLSEDPGVTVGVLEAGENNPLDIPEITIPGYFGRVLKNPKYDWSFSTVPQKHLNDREVYQPRGKALGGSSSINFMCFGRASAAEYDAFEKLGNPGWNWESFCYYMKKGEGISPPPSTISSSQGVVLDYKVHGFDGPIKQTYPLWNSNLHSPFFDACKGTDVHVNPDPAAGKNIGVSSLISAINPKDATRVSSYVAYLRPNQERQNLVVLTSAHATKVVFGTSSTGKELVAQGVEFIHCEERYVAKAKKEVILAAGSYQTPQLLELSGIGQKTYTTDMGIKQLVDLPGVGENLQDHGILYNMFEIQDNFETYEMALDAETRDGFMNLYKSKKQGMYSAVSSAWAFIPAVTVMESESLKIIEKGHIEAISSGKTPGLKKQLELQLKWLNDPNESLCEIILTPCMMLGLGTPESGKRYMTLMSILLRGLSRGHVHISSSDPTAPPVIDPQYLSNSTDLDMLVGMIKYVRRLANTEPLKSAIVATITPSPDAQSDEELAEHVKRSMNSIYHPTGTASMLPRDDNGVVNPRLIVYGTKNLRIADASIIPILFSAHTQATVYAIAEKAADLIKEDNV